MTNFLWKFTKLEQVFICHLQTYELFLQFHERIHDISWWILVRIPSTSYPNNWANLGCNSFLLLLGRGKANDTEHIHQQQLWNIYEMLLKLLFMLPFDINFLPRKYQYVYNFTCWMIRRQQFANLRKTSMAWRLLLCLVRCIPCGGICSSRQSRSRIWR